jgi:hypothetical protein
MVADSSVCLRTEVHRDGALPMQGRITFGRNLGSLKTHESGRAGLAKCIPRCFKNVTRSTEIALQKNNNATLRAQRPVANRGHMCRLKFVT